MPASSDTFHALESNKYVVSVSLAIIAPQVVLTALSLPEIYQSFLPNRTQRLSSHVLLIKKLSFVARHGVGNDWHHAMICKCRHHLWGYLGRRADWPGSVNVMVGHEGWAVDIFDDFRVKQRLPPLNCRVAYFTTTTIQIIEPHYVCRVAWTVGGLA